ncbi:maleylpyruvate isomerase family mycothiol-dependent enzyme [Kineococcus sp. SYSU DK003]|uniref:maleylpyruvate isomerase family mycothiol-dependent enzyme n=1 Tax=Kineococcus sp. SYSU DK003 TaxID=3383124 RepID=UPI003D7C7664
MDDATWRMVTGERLSLADLLEGLTARQWEHPSLCSRWRVKDVAAHLVMTPAREPPVGTLAAALLRNRGRLWDAGCDVVVAYAARPSGRITAELRSLACSRERPVFVRDENILPDLVVHGQDIALPLGIDRTVPREAAVVALERFWGLGWPFHAQRRLRGTRFEAPDCGWSAGEGELVTGDAAALLLLFTGRTAAALERLHGPGLGWLRELSPR